MPVQIVIKGSDQKVHMNSGKYVWGAAGHAKAAMRTSGLSHSSLRELQAAFPDHIALNARHGWRHCFKWEELEDILEIQELRVVTPARELELVRLLRSAAMYIDKADPLYAAVQEALKGEAE